MKYDYCSWLVGQGEESIKKIIHCSIKKQKDRQVWMQEQLTPDLWKNTEKNGELTWNNLFRLSVLAHDDRIKTKGRVEDIKIIYRGKIIQHPLDFSKEFDLLKAIFPYPPDLDIKGLPENSWAIQFTFRLAKPYISRDDTPFYVIDNPVRKEWVFKVPFIAASQWKGALRSVMMQEMVADFSDQGKFTEARLRLYRLFGNEKDCSAGFLNECLARHLMGTGHEYGQDSDKWNKKIEEKGKEIGREFEKRLAERGLRKGDSEGLRGCLYFFPTYFDTIGLEVINPHSRETGSGTNPISIECIPEGKEGTFAILYIPFDKADRKQALQDARITAKGILAMMTKYGFGAKASSGFGSAEASLPQEGIFEINSLKEKGTSLCHFKIKSLTELVDNIDNLMEDAHEK